MAADPQPDQSRSNARHWCFTAFGTTTELHPELDWPWDDQVYGVYQHEKCPETGRFHLQGFVSFNKQVRLSYVKRLHKKARWSVARKLPAANRRYCTKLESRVDGTEPFEFGEFNDLSSQGRSTEYAKAMELIKIQPATSELEFALCAPSVWLRFPNAYGRVRQLFTLDSRRSRGVRVVIYVGGAGCGKSSDVMRRYPGAYWKSAGKWWDNYQQQQCIVFDDFDGSWLTCTELLRILDRYPLLVETKGSHVNLDAADTFVITSNVRPEEWYSQHFARTPAHKKALLRRITTILEFIGTPETPLWRINSGADYMAPPHPVPISGYEPFFQPADPSQYVVDLSTIDIL